MLNNLEFSSKSGERRLYSLVALILALLTVMSVITFVVICLPAASASSSGLVDPPSDETPSESGDPDTPSHPKVENWANADDLSGCMIEVGQSAEDMLDIIFSSRIFDVGYYYQPNNINKILITKIARPLSTDFASEYEEKKDGAITQVNNINKFFEETFKAMGK